jgi:hypothetical protein
MKNIAKAILLVLAATVVCILGWKTYRCYQMNKFVLIETRLHQQTVAEWKKASTLEKTSACAIGWSGHIRHIQNNTSLLSERTKKAIVSQQGYQHYSELCAEYIDEYLRQSRPADTTRISSVMMQVSLYKGWLNMPEASQEYLQQMRPINNTAQTI